MDRTPRWIIARTLIALPIAASVICPPHAEARDALTVVSAHAAPHTLVGARSAEAPRAQDVQAPRIEPLQAPRGQRIQAPREEPIQAPRGQSIQAPREEPIQAPRGQSVHAPRE